MILAKTTPTQTVDGRFEYADAPRNVYWEMTRACDLACKHCRASAIPNRDPFELDTAEAKRLLTEVKGMGSMVVLTGGDPMKREDLFELIAFARRIGLPVAITPAITPKLTREDIRQFAHLGVAALGVSLDGPTAEIHDEFRGVPGTFDRSMETLAWAREFRLPVQVNTTVTRDTLPHLKELCDVLHERGTPAVRRWSLFFLVPVGRGAELALPRPEDVEGLFAWIYSLRDRASFRVSTVEAPQYRRYWVQRRLEEGVPPQEIGRLWKTMGFGIRDGNGVIFVSHTGDVFPAGFLDYPLLGNVKESRLSEIYRAAPGLEMLRDMDCLKGKCGRCEFRWLCGGSRARAYGMAGDPMQSDPLCAYEPH